MFNPSSTLRPSILEFDIYLAFIFSVPSATGRPVTRPASENTWPSCTRTPPSPTSPKVGPEGGPGNGRHLLKRVRTAKSPRRSRGLLTSISRRPLRSNLTSSAERSPRGGATSRPALPLSTGTSHPPPPGEVQSSVLNSRQQHHRRAGGRGRQRLFLTFDQEKVF